MSASLTALLDVAFQLLIYFVCIASFAMSELALPTTLPATEVVLHAPPKEIQELELVHISLSQQADQLRIELNGNRMASVADLRDRLLQLRALANLPAVLHVAPEVEIAHVVAVYDLCLTVGVREIRFATPDG